MRKRNLKMRCEWILLLLVFIGTAAHGETRTLSTFPSLVSDHRPWKEGQILTVLIFEEASSLTNADTRSSKSVDLAGSVEITGEVDERGAVSINNNSAGQGSITRKGRLVASISAIVQEILPAGELRIYGEQTIEFNDETQFIRVSGLVRPEDILGDNTVLSTRIAQGEITYKGEGLLGSRQKPGFLTRFFNWLF